MKRTTTLLIAIVLAHIAFAQGKAKVDYNQLAPGSNVTTAPQASQTSPVKTVVSVNELQPGSGTAQQNSADKIPFNQLPQRKPQAAKAADFNQLAK